MSLGGNMELSNKELLEIDGGASFYTAAFINAAARGISTVMNVGRSLGTAIRRLVNGKWCSL